MLEFFHWAYRKLGRRYPRAIVWLQHQFAHVIVLVGVAGITLYEPLGSDFWRIVLVAEALMVLENLFGYRLASRMLRPVDAWLCGDRSRTAAVAAWRALAELPSQYMRRWKWYPILGNVLPFCVYVTVERGWGWPSLFFLLAGGLVVLVYGMFLRFFAMELAMRPVIEDVSRDLPADFELGEAGIPLRTRLMLALPMLNVITGVAVAGLSANDDATLADLGVDVVVAVAVAFSIALELTYLLTRSIVDPIARLQEATQRVARGELEVRAPVASTDETGRLAQSFNEAVAGLRERERLREAFGAYVAPDVAERVLAEGVSLEGEEVEATMVFVDIREFTAFAERSSAREVVAVLNDFFAAVVPVLVRHGGLANKFVGDGLLGVFGAPERRADHADRAVAAALEIAGLVRSRFDGRLRIGIGVNSGLVVAGTVGGGGHVEFTVIGDAVNTAARVEEATRVLGDEILVTSATCALLSRDFGGWEERPPIPLKGKREEVALFAPRVVARAAFQRMDDVATFAAD